MIEPWLVRVIFYLWAIYEIGTLGSTYYYEWNSNGKSKAFLGTLLLSVSILSLMVFMTGISIISHWYPEVDQIIRSTVILPVLFSGLTARLLRSAYKKGER